MKDAKAVQIATMVGTEADAVSSSPTSAAASIAKKTEPDPENTTKKKKKKTSSNKTKSTKSKPPKSASSKSKPKTKSVAAPAKTGNDGEVTATDAAADGVDIGVLAISEKSDASSSTSAANVAAAPTGATAAAAAVVSKVKMVAMSCGCCKSFVRVPVGTTKFTCLQCKVINFTNREESMEDIKAMYESLDWMQFTHVVSCPRCQNATWIPKKALIFVCYECGCIGDADGHRLGVMRNGSRTHAAVFGLTKHMLSTPWLFWPFFFKSAVDGSK